MPDRPAPRSGEDVGTARRALGAKGLAVADQAVSSLGNVVLTVIVARSVSPTAFGEYALLLTGYQLLVAGAQAVVGEPLLVTYRRKTGRAPDTMIPAALGVALAIGLLGLAAALAASLAFQLGPALWCLGLLMPGLLVQDAQRYVAFARLRPGHALLSDLSWTALQLLLTGLLLGAGVKDVWALVLAWGGPASVAAIGVAILTRTRPALTEGPRWIRSTRHLSGRFAVESAASTGAYQLVVVIATATAGIVVAGQLRLVQALFGPLHVLVTGVRAVSLPEVVERIHRGQSCRSIVSGTAAALGAAAAAWTAILLLVPQDLGAAAFGAAWGGLGSVILLFGLQKVAESVGTGPYLVHRARQLASWTLRVRLAATAVMTGGAVVLAPRWGAAGAGAALLLGSTLAVCCWWARYARDARATPTAGRTRGGRHRRSPGLPFVLAVDGRAGGGTGADACGEPRPPGDRRVPAATSLVRTSPGGQPRERTAGPDLPQPDR